MAARETYTRTVWVLKQLGPPGGGWRAVYDGGFFFDGGEVACWGLADRVCEYWYENANKPHRVEVEETCAVGLVASDLGLEIAESVDNFAGYCPPGVVFAEWSEAREIGDHLAEHSTHRPDAPREKCPACKAGVFRVERAAAGGVPPAPASGEMARPRAREEADDGG